MHARRLNQQIELTHGSQNLRGIAPTHRPLPHGFGSHAHVNTTPWWESGKAEFTIVRWQGGTWKSIM